MADISMCQNSKCKSANACYRFTAKPNDHRQNYSVFNTENKYICPSFISNGSDGTRERRIL